MREKVVDRGVTFSEGGRREVDLVFRKVRHWQRWQARVLQHHCQLYLQQISELAMCPDNKTILGLRHATCEKP
jgi:hypothetical protein